MKGFKEFIECGPYSEYCKHLQGVCKSRELVMEKIGSAGSHSLYCVQIDNNKKRTVCISACIHGDEQAGPWAVGEFLANVNLKNHAHNYIIFPVANPTGFDVCKRRNHQKRDLNRHFRGERLTGENKILYDALKGKDLSLFYSLHEHPLARGFYVYVSSDIDPAFSEKMISLAREHRFKIRKHHFDGEKIDGEVRLDKLEGDRSFEDRMFEEGVPYIVTETPGTEDFNKRVKLQYELLKMIMENSIRVSPTL